MFFALDKEKDERWEEEDVEDQLGDGEGGGWGGHLRGAVLRRKRLQKSRTRKTAIPYLP